jgi:hypothetical protein
MHWRRQGEVVLERPRSRKRKKLVLGRKSFSVNSGEAFVRMKLSKKGRRAVLRERRLKARVTFLLGGARAESKGTRLITIAARGVVAEQP